MIRLEDLRLFVRSAALGSFSRAAREANLLPAQVSAAIKRLERELNIRLFARSTRSLRLTIEGEHYLPYARDVLDTLKRGEEELSFVDSHLKGTLQLAAPSDLGRNVLLPWLNDFRREYPEVDLHLRLSDQVSDIYREPIDVAIRYGYPDDASYIALPLDLNNRAVLVASPDYLARHQPLACPEDISAHAGLLYMIHGRQFDHWPFRRGEEEKLIHVSGTLVSDDADIVRRWAVAGQGLAYKSWLDVADDLHTGKLVMLLPEWQGRAVPLYLVCPHRKQFSPLVRRLYEHLQIHLAAMTEGRQL